MKMIISVLMFVLLSAAVIAAPDHVVITEVLYDPTNTDSGGEAVQLLNPTASSVDISGWVIATETSATDATIPDSTILFAGSSYLVADVGWSENKDNSVWPNADLEEAITLANTDAGVALINNTVIIDAVGWGIASNIAAGFYEGNPAEQTDEGRSLQRRKIDGEYVDTNENSIDFLNGTPVFGFSSATGLTLTIEAIITGAAPSINSITIVDEDETTPGIQVSPVPKQNKSLTITAQITDSNSAEDIVEVELTIGSDTYLMSKTSTIDSTTALFEANISLPYYYPAGNYIVNIAATDNADFTTQSSTSFEYLSLIALELDAASVVFSASPGSTTEIFGDNDFETTSNPTLLNIGNVEVDIEVSGTNLAAGQNIIPANNVLYSLGNGYRNLTLAKQTEQTNLAPSITAPLSLRLQVPLATQPGSYFGSLSIAGVAS